MKKFVFTILCCSLVCTILANTDYRKAGLGVPRYSNHGFELSVSHSNHQSAIEKTVIAQKKRSKKTSSTKKITHKTTVNSINDKEKITTKQMNNTLPKIQQNKKLAKSIDNKLDSTGIIITLIIVIGVLLAHAMIIFGWYWLVFGMWY